MQWKLGERTKRKRRSSLANGVQTSVPQFCIMVNFNSLYTRYRMISIALGVLSIGIAIAVIGFLLTTK